MKSWLLALALIGGCQSRTEVVIGIATDLHATDQIHFVQLDVLVNGVPLANVGDRWEIAGAGAPALQRLPASYGIASDGENSQIQLVLSGFKDGTQDAVVKREAVLSFVDGETLFYRMGLTASCLTTGCADGQTCVEGECREPLLDAKAFPAFNDDLVTTLTCDSGSHYVDTSTNEPMLTSPDAAACPAGLCHEGTCLIPPDSRNISLEAAPGEAAKILCAKEFSCCTPTEIAARSNGDYADEAGCRVVYTSFITQYAAEVQAQIDRGVVSYDGTLLGACLDALDRASCASYSEGSDSSACDAFVRGKVANGGACTPGSSSGVSECTSAYCAPDGHCQALPARGGACPDFRCAKGLYCDANSLCQNEATVGQSCAGGVYCSRGLYCDSGTSMCQQERPDGASCSSDDECASFTCSGTPGVCVGTCHG